MLNNAKKKKFYIHVYSIQFHIDCFFLEFRRQTITAKRYFVENYT